MANRDSRLKELERLVEAEGSGERRFLMQIVMERFSKEELREATDAYLAAHPDVEWPNGILALDIVRGEDGRPVAFNSKDKCAPWQHEAASSGYREAAPRPFMEMSSNQQA